MRDITVLMTGCGAPGAHGIIKCLRKNGERNIRIIGVDMNENAGARDMVDVFDLVPPAASDDFIDAVLAICKAEKVDVVLPIVTRELMKFSLNRDRFEAVGTKVSVMKPETLEIVNNKAHLLTALKDAGIPTPEFIVAHTADEVEAACYSLGFPNGPVCVKCAVGNGSRGVRILDFTVSKYDLFFNQKPNSMYISFSELMETLRERDEIPEMLVMEFLPGVEYSVDIIMQQGLPHGVVIRRGLSVLTSNMMSLVIEDNADIAEYAIHAAQAVGADGNFGFDLLLNREGEPRIIEMNPRLTGGVVACSAAGVNLPYLGVKQMLGESFPSCLPVYGTRMFRRYQERFFAPDGSPIDW